jgi:hypothetical protein
MGHSEASTVGHSACAGLAAGLVSPPRIGPHVVIWLAQLRKYLPPISLLPIPLPHLTCPSSPLSIHRRRSPQRRRPAMSPPSPSRHLAHLSSPTTRPLPLSSFASRLAFVPLRRHPRPQLIGELSNRRWRVRPHLLLSDVHEVVGQNPRGCGGSGGVVPMRFRGYGRFPGQDAPPRCRSGRRQGGWFIVKNGRRSS